MHTYNSEKEHLHDLESILFNKQKHFKRLINLYAIKNHLQ